MTIIKSEHILKFTAWFYAILGLVIAIGGPIRFYMRLTDLSITRMEATLGTQIYPLIGIAFILFSVFVSISNYYLKSS